MILYGAGGHAKNIFDCLVSVGLSLSAIFDDDRARHTFFETDIWHEYSAERLPEEKLIVSIGDNKARFVLANKIKHPFGTVVHSSVWMATNVQIGQGTVVMAGAVLQTEAGIGQHAIINTSAIVEHECTIGNFAHIGPGAVVCGAAQVGEGALIGANATILPGISVGKWAIVGAGAVVTRNIDDGVKVAGNPARIV
ncbi:MAG: acetyltransferase [Cyclobacteriaceae bacterium]|nr:acetyltransferase [Cyclobacteriaceae bacterium]